MGAAGDFDGSLCDVEMLREELHESSISLAVVGLDAEIDSKFARRGFYDFFLARAWFDGDAILCHSYIIHYFVAF